MPNCSCSVFANSPSRWCEKHGERWTEEDSRRAEREQSLFYKAMMGAIADSGDPPDELKHEIRS